MRNYTVGWYDYIINYGYGLIVTKLGHCSDHDAIPLWKPSL